AAQERIAPRNQTEADLAAIWRTLLKLDEVGVRDDFFALGGQSFDAVRCVALIQERFGRALSLSDMWQGRTIEALARRLTASADARHAHLQQIGQRRPGPALYFVHPAGGQLVGYYDLAQAMQRNCAGFLATADDAASDGLATIELIAARYVSELLQAQPAGPYALAGWSSGGCIAFEMALQLETMGHQVNQLLLFDCPGPQLHARIEELDMMRGFFEDLDLGLDLAGMEAAAQEAADTEARFASVARHLGRGGVRLNAADLYPFYRVFKKVVDAVRAYRPVRACAARQVLLLRASEGSVGEFHGHPYGERDDWGWLDLIDGALLTAWMPGSHYTMLRGAHASAVAALLNRHAASAPAASAA
ncbi:MAG TPA: thioesterase domain-containing protein, partial [Telluria sp.]|nr:thioesterase domain-containing protein [Telluria sp.]